MLMTNTPEAECVVGHRSNEWSGPVRRSLLTGAQRKAENYRELLDNNLDAAPPLSAELKAGAYTRSLLSST
jgi:hypothetical protein